MCAIGISISKRQAMHISLFVCLFGVFHPTWEFFTHMEASPLLVNAYARHSWGIRLKWSFSRTRDTHTYCPAFESGTVTTFFKDLGLSRMEFEHPTFRPRGYCSFLLIIPISIFNEHIIDLFW